MAGSSMPSRWPETNHRAPAVPCFLCSNSQNIVTVQEITMAANLPALFIGSSSEGMEIARAIRTQLSQDCDVTVWNEGSFGLMESNLESLVNALDRFDFAILVLTPDATVVDRARETLAPRDNLLFELGLFMGSVGRTRTFGVCKDTPNMKLPSDLAGVTLARFSDRPDNLESSRSPRVRV
jgi:predicted nucleotide-binding protein